MDTYTLRISVDPNVCRALIDAGYKLCVARKISEKYDVVWSCTDFMVENELQWKDNFALFCTNSFKSGSPVWSGGLMPIAFGQTCTLDSSRRLNPPTGLRDDSGTFYFENLYRPIHSGVADVTGEQFTPMFVFPDEVAVGKFAIITHPVTIMVWFDRDLTAGTMFLPPIPNAIEVPYQRPSTQHIRYQDYSTWRILDTSSSELGLSSVTPTSTELITDDQSNIENLPVALLGYGTDIALDRDAYSKTAVVGDKYKVALLSLSIL
jgi:hypothetical protein